MPEKAKPAGASGGHRIEILNWKVYPKNSLRAFFSASLASGMTIHNLMLHERDGTRWIAFPSQSYRKNGVTAYTPVLEIKDPQTRTRFQTEMLRAIDRHLELERAGC